MAVNKREAVKHVRDKAKAAYIKQSECHICGSMSELELHHTSSLTLLLEKWARDTGTDISTDAAIIAVREEFIDQHHSEIYLEVFTLCNKHHIMLHRVFGKAPPLTSSQKQIRWIEKQKAKVLGIEVIDEEKSSAFNSFYSDSTVPKSTFSKFY